MVLEKITGQVVFQWNWTKEHPALTSSLNFSVVYAAFITWILSSILSHQPRVQDIAELPATYPHPWVMSKLHIYNSFWIFLMTQCRYKFKDPQISSKVRSVFSWERGRSILLSSGHGGGIPLFLFLFSPCAPSSDPKHVRTRLWEGSHKDWSMSVL